MPTNDTVVITGSSGFIGAATVKRLSRDYRVVGFDREDNPHPPPEAECEVVRGFRFLNVPFAIWLILSPWLLAGDTTASLLNNILVGLILIPLSLPLGPVRERFGPLQRYIV